MKALGRTIAIATVALAAAAFAAQAQTTPAPATPATKAPAAKAVPKKATKPAPATASQCKGLAQPACTAKAAECTWIAAAKTKKGKEIKAYCRSKPKKKS